MFARFGVAVARPISLMVLLLVGYFLFLYYPIFTQGALLAPVDLALLHAPWSAARPSDYRIGSYTLSDLMDSYVPPFKMVSDAIRAGHVPFYTDKIQNGIPWLLVSRNEVGSPFVLPFLLLFGPIFGYSLSVFFKFCMGGIFFYRLVRSWNLVPFAATLGAFVFVANAYPVQRLSHGLGTMYFLIPVALYGLQRALAGSNLAICLTPIVLQGIFASGYPPAVAFHATLYAAYILFWLLTVPEQRIAGLARVSLVAILTLALVLPSLVETYQYLIADQERTYRTNYWAFGLPQHSIVSALVPWGFGEDGPDGFVWVRYGIYIGILPLITMLLGFLLPHKRNQFLFFAVFFFYVLLVLFSSSFRDHIYRYVPILNGTMANNQVMIYGFVAAVLASFGMDQLIRRELKPSRVLLSLLVIIGILVASIWYWRNLFALADHSKIAAAAALLAISIALILAFIWFPNLRSPLQAAMLMIVFADLLLMGAGYNHTVPPKLVYPETPAVSFAKKYLGDGKLFMLDTAMLADTPLWHSIRTFAGMGFFTRDTLALYRLINPDAFANHATQYLFPGTPNTRLGSSLVDALGIRYVVANPDYAHVRRPYMDGFRTAVGEPKFRLVHDGDAAIFENTTAMPTAFVVPLVGVLPREDIYREMSTDTRDLRRFAWIEQDSTDASAGEVLLANNNIPLTSSVTGGRDHDGAQHFVAVVNRPALLVIGDNFHPGWRVRVNGESRPLLRVDFALRGIVLRPGVNTIELRYLPRHLEYGVPLILATLLGLLTSSIFFLSKDYLSSLRSRKLNNAPLSSRP